jgi:hypothetical protein
VPIRRMLLDKNPGRADEFPITIRRLIGEFDSSTMRPTKPFKDAGVNCYELGLPGYVAFIKVDERPTPQPIGDLTLAPGKPLVIRVDRSPLTLARIAQLSHPSRSRRKQRIVCGIGGIDDSAAPHQRHARSAAPGRH